MGVIGLIIVRNMHACIDYAIFIEAFLTFIYIWAL